MIGRGEVQLLREQHASLARLVPVLYAVVIVTTLIVSIAFTGTAPSWIVHGIPGALLLPIAYRLHYWMKARKAGPSFSLRRIRRDILGTLILSPLLALSFAAVGVALFFYGDPYQQALVGIVIWITSIACAFCVAALPAAAITIVASSSVPLIGIFIASGIDLMRMLAGIVAAISMQVGYMLMLNFNAFRATVQSHSDLEERRQAAERAEVEATRLALTDYLTGLSNRRHFEQRLSEHVALGERNTLSFALGILDLNNFKPINDVYGHSVGDAVLITVAARISSIMQGKGHIARIAGDEFALLFDHSVSVADAMQHTANIQNTLSQPILVEGGHRVTVSSSLGIATYPESCKDAARLMDQAEIALYKSKSSMQGAACLFTPEHESAALERARIENGLRKAIAEQSLDVHFQPILDLETQKLTGFEALARWRDPELGQVSPAIFVPIAEQSGLVDEMTYVLLRKAATVAASWPAPLVLSFNLSPSQLVKESAGLRIIQILAECGLPAHRFDAEVTETALMTDLPAAKRTIDALKAAGARISLDDFGTGYSSLSQIRHLPLDKVKIDKSFIDQICSDGKMQSLVHSIITMCKTLDLKCVAEGIEHQSQLDALRHVGCFAGQGYLFARPTAEKDLPRLIRQSRARRQPKRLPVAVAAVA